MSDEAKPKPDAAAPRPQRALRLWKVKLEPSGDEVIFEARKKSIAAFKARIDYGINAVRYVNLAKPEDVKRIRLSGGRWRAVPLPKKKPAPE